MKNVPKLRFSGFSDEWEEKKLGELLEFKNGINADKEAYGKGVKFINVLDILSNNYITAEKIVGRVDIDDDTLQKYGVNFGDVVFQRSSETREEVGTANVYLDYETVTFGGFVIRGKKIGDYEPSFMNNLLKSSSARKEITTKSGGSTRYNVGQETLSAVGLRFPKLEEQEKIANFLTKVDNIIEKQDEKVSNLELYKKGMMQKIFSQEIRFKKDDGGEYPEWNQKQLGEIGYFKTSSVDKLINEDEKSVKLVNYMDVYRHIELSNNTNLSIVTAKDNQIIENNLRKGDILFTPSSETPEDIGHSSVIFEDLNNAVYSYHLIRFRPKIKINILYSHYFCNVDKVRSQIVKYATGSTRFTVSLKSFEKIIVELPCLDEQSKIANFLFKIDTIVGKEKEKLDELRTWKKGLLQGMFI